MTGANLGVHEDEFAVKRRQRLAWVIMLAVIGCLLVLRAVIGSTVGPEGKETTVHAFGTVFVERSPMSFHQVGDGKWESTKVAEDGVPGGLAGGVAPDPTAGTVSWTEYKRSTPAAYYAAEAESATQTKIEFSWPRTMGLWAAAFFTLAVFSFLIRDNPGYKFTESVVIGVSAAYWMTVAF